jgi:hypothetical protein
MFGSTNDLWAVMRYQAELRDEAERRRKTARVNHDPKPKGPARRVFGLRLSIA